MSTEKMRGGIMLNAIKKIYTNITSGKLVIGRSVTTSARSYPDEFRILLVDAVHEGQTHKFTSEEYMVSEHTVCKACDDYKKGKLKRC